MPTERAARNCLLPILNVRVVRLVWKTYAIRFHDLRHSAGSLMLLSGASIAGVKEILGHSSIAITAAIYLHSYEATKRAAVAGAAQLLRKRDCPIFIPSLIPPHWVKKKRRALSLCCFLML
jgi:integrase